MQQKIYDIIIAGAGPAGLTAAVYARRAGKSVLLIEKEAFGGQITLSPHVENYPFTRPMSGNELVEARREGKTLNELIANLKEPCESAEARLNVLLDDTADYTAAVLETVKEHFSNLPGFEIVQPNYEGVRVNADETHGNGWFLVRRSLHDPLMPCNIESNSVGGMRLIAAELYNALRAFDKLELEPLKKLM